MNRIKQKPKSKVYQKFIKRKLDFTVSLLAIILLSPLLTAVAILVKIKLGSPVIFKQQRPGLDEKIFTLYKFRTMTDKKGRDGRVLPDDERLTRFGKILRAASLDELPQLLNILKGDMSIIGPRPLLAEYLPLYDEEQKKRHKVRPGLSGLAQVRGRNAIDWKEKINWDMEYINQISFIGDLRLICLTVKNVLLQKGISTMTKLIIIGAGEHGCSVANVALHMHKYATIAFLDDTVTINPDIGMEVMGTISEADKYIKDYEIFVGIGDNKMRERIQCQLEQVGATIPTLIHPRASLGRQVTLGRGTVVMAGALINCKCRIKQGCIINTAAIVDHDGVIEDYAHISAGAILAGNVSVGEKTFVGVGAVLRNKISIGSNTIIGMGSVVTKCIPDKVIVYGNPAKIIKDRL